MNYKDKKSSNYYRIIIRPKEAFATLHTQNIDAAGIVKRISGKRTNGTWSTQAWLVHKSSAHSSDGLLVGDSKEVKNLFAGLGSLPEHVEGSIFRLNID